jgi:hypothetical protein
MNTMNSVAQMGHNNPPNDVAVLQETLAEKNAELLERQKELLAAVERVPESCDTEEMAGKFTDMVKLIRACAKSLDSQRTAEKEPYMTLERTVDGFFKPKIELLDRAKAKVEKLLGAYMFRKAEEERRRQREEAERQRREAEERARQAEELAKANMPQIAAATMDEAVALEKQADSAQKLSEGRAAKLASVHGDYGSRSSLRSYKMATILSREDIDLEALRAHLSTDAIQTALNSWMKANWKDDSNPPVLKGANFTIETKAQVR